MIKVIPAEKPYVPNLGDLVCDFERMSESDPKPSRFLESTPRVKPRKLTQEELKEFSGSEELYEYLENMHKQTLAIDLRKQILPLSMIDMNPWLALQALGIDGECLKVPYECPYTGYEFFAIVPSALISDDLATKYANVRHWNKEMLFDHAFTRHLYKEGIFKLNDAAKIMLGTGWTQGTRASDGSRSKIACTVRLDNGDQLFVFTWEWYNK